MVTVAINVVLVLLSLPTEIKYAVSLSVLKIRAERRPFVPPERAGPSASLNALMAAKTSAFHRGSARRGCKRRGAKTVMPKPRDIHASLRHRVGAAAETTRRSVISRGSQP
jgi:hypothetical protein